MSGPRAKRQQTLPQCLLCKALIEESTAPGLWLHTTSSSCAVKVTDRFGVSLDERYEVVGDEIFEKEAEEDRADFKGITPLDGLTTSNKIHLPVISGGIAVSGSGLNFSLSIPTFKNHEEAINNLFKEYNVEKLGGASGDLGWSSFYSFQRCPYLWSRNYLEGERFSEDNTPIAFIIGSTLHLLLALRYQIRIDLAYPINPEKALQFLFQEGVNPDALAEARRLYETYDLTYVEESYLKPLAVEYHTVDPRTKESCRYDMIASIDSSISPLFIDPIKTEDVKAPELIDIPSGTVVVEHKTSSRRDENSVTGWINDGEIIGQQMLYNRLKLYRKFGPLIGTLVNLVGKQKSPSMDRIFVPVNRELCRQHTKDLKFYQAFRQLCLAQDHFPRARANCINRWGKCSQWEHCTGID